MKLDRKNNLFWRLMRTESSSAQGHEDFVTEALAAVLIADQKLTRHLLNSLIGEETNPCEPINITTQSEYPSERVGLSIIDLELRANSHLVFVEIKISASLNTYFVESDTQEEIQRIDQIEKYDFVLSTLDDSYPAHRYLFAIGQEPLKQPSKDLIYFQQDYLWWDIYRIIDHYCSRIPASKLDDEVGSYLVNQFLLFLKISKLDPPNALRISNFSRACAFRILAEAIRNSGEFDKISRLQKQSGFIISLDQRKFTIWFDNQPSLRATEEKVGSLIVPDLSDSFWEAEIVTQINMLSEIIGQLPILDRDDTAPVKTDAALTQFRDSELATEILDAILERWPQYPSIGKGTSTVREISCQTGAIRVRLAPYPGYDRVILNTDMKYGWIDLARQHVREILNFEEPVSKRAKGQLNIPMQIICGPEELQKLLEIIEKLAILKRPS